MPVDNIQKKYNLSREAASRLLKVSIRTLDRYIKGKKMSTMVVDGRIWLSKGEVEQFKVDRGQKVIVDNVDMSTSRLSIDNVVDNVDGEVDKVDTVTKSGDEFVDILTTPRLKKHNHDGDGIYSKIYAELREELSEKQERLEIANYRVGQLENQLRNSVPMLEYHRENYEKKKAEKELKNKLNESMTVIQNLYQKIKYHKFSKKVFIIALLIVLALQPLWLLVLNPFE